VQVAVALEKAALTDEYFVKRKLYPNVDFYSGLIYRWVFPTFSIVHFLLTRPYMVSMRKERVITIISFPLG
jgi:hypothetical protein